MSQINMQSQMQLVRNAKVKVWGKIPEARMLITIFSKQKLVIYVNQPTNYFSYANSLRIDLRFNISKIWVIFAWPVWLIDWSILSLILDKSFGFKPESSGKILVIKSLSTSFTVFRIDLTVSWRKTLRQLWPADRSLKWFDSVNLFLIHIRISQCIC